MTDYPVNSTAKVYYDIDGNPKTLHQMVRDEPEWAESRIKAGEGAIAERDALAAHVEAGKAILGERHPSYALREWAKTAPETSLARLKAQWQAELDAAINHYDSIQDGITAANNIEEGDRMRRQGEDA